MFQERIVTHKVYERRRSSQMGFVLADDLRERKRGRWVVCPAGVLNRKLFGFHACIWTASNTPSA